MKAAVLLLCGVCLVSAGCTRVLVKTGARVPLATLAVDTMQASLPNGPAIAPGERSPLVVTFQQPDGTLLTTEGAGHGKVLWQDLVVKSSVVTVDKKGVVTLGDDPRASFGKTGHLEISVPTHAGLHTSLDIPVSYAHGYTLSLSGNNGSDGLNGMDGTDGSAGSTGSFDPDHPVAGGNGTSGSSGTNGGDGSNGYDGPPIEVRMALLPGATTPLLQVAVSANGSAERFYLLAAQGGSLLLSSEGGRGGSGGKGGRAGRGGAAGVGSPNGMAGSDGFAGQNGSDGRQGSDGRITVRYDPAAKPYLSVLRVASPGQAVFQERATGPLW